MNCDVLMVGRILTGRPRHNLKPALFKRGLARRWSSITDSVSMCERDDGNGMAGVGEMK